MHSILVFIAGGVFGLLGGCVLSVGAYDKGYEDAEKGRNRK